MTVEPPLGMLAELTHRCPLHCPYCSNPVELAAKRDELTTAQWLEVIEAARDLGVLQVHLSGGEPLLRPDLPELVARASELGCYVNLVTSGLGLTESRLADLAERGLAHVQLSVQGADAARADRIAGAKAHARKVDTAAVVRAVGLPLSVNVVLHRANHDQVEELIDLAERMGADRLELANTQYYGWALRNRTALMPTPEQLAAAEPVVRAAIERLRGRMEIVYVVADYYERYPKPCMYGWGARQLTVAPNGDVLPCPAASVITTLDVENVKRRPLGEIWYESASFNAFRGEDWMRDPCRTCDRRALDFGGCRCQAFMLTGDASATDPVCSRSPDRSVVDGILAGEAETVASAGVPDFVMRAPTVTR
ncbi:pyrroloquinoline quinone biosynthesis protein PqqE [Actinophytocola gossypii]|uniref:pyrroloquinoline quinone biosynthesis protein PqqE n=1 Tax=Actinophytocola gossypii TaxID=2812003 RepID=UPI0035CD11F4